MTCTEILILGPLGVLLGAFCAAMFVILRILEIGSRQNGDQDYNNEDEEAESLLKS
eukprot:CAMPEP_0116874400 /NCGR_PEP_ID=MMETSP0463-20121206/5852_1 /TAXON_ID=181622 /ORGANISM="Strombidinopsis sp, Strain SopsisLIS2011" /LENGTH=55 /DNA_ID=CAMNT_0004517987 /DNA_START=616 /DNA_END=783 /DNA_ORIENTATION=-